MHIAGRSGADVERNSIAVAPGATLVGDYRRGLGTDFAVVWVHGFGSHRGGEKATAVRDECAPRGWAFAAFDFRGHGESSGTLRDLRPSHLIADLESVRDFLASRGHTRLGLVASSMGAFAAAWFARAHPEAVAGCVFLAPAFGFLERRWNPLTEAERAEWKRTNRLRVANEWLDVEVGYGLAEEREQFPPHLLPLGWRTPSLLFHGLADETVPETDSLDFVRAVAYPQVELRLIKDGDHRLTAYKDEIAHETGRFFTRLLAGGRR
jgi:pimeloyl-ACP methyl ester carboxylesterase